MLLFGYSAQRLQPRGAYPLRHSLWLAWISTVERHIPSEPVCLGPARIGGGAPPSLLARDRPVLPGLGGVFSSGLSVPEGLGEYLQRLRPLMLWVAGAGAAALLLLLCARRSAGAKPALAPPPTLSAARIALAIFLDVIWRRCAPILPATAQARS
jgi:hypothetical protein